MSQSVGSRRGVVAAAGAAGAAALIALIVLATSAGGNNGSYEVRAIFDDAANIIPAENVKVDGVTVGSVKSVTPTPQEKAAVVMSISNPGFKDFRADASCTIRPQALLGEKYVDCLPTQPRVEGTPLPPPLRTIPHGQEGEGEKLLPVTNTSSPVDPDLLNDITRLPERERLTIILNELGAGLADRGSDLRAVIQRANPALQELDKVLAILAGENRVLAKLSVDSDKELGPLAEVRKQYADYVAQSNTVAQASARHLLALEQNLALFPPFLRQLGPSMERLAHFAEETTPVFTDLGIAAPSIDQAFTKLPAYSASSTAFFKSLGKTAKVSGPALVAIQPLLARLKPFGAAAKPFATNFSKLFTSLRETGGLERIMDFIFVGANAANGYDALGHFLRTEGIATICVTYQSVQPSAGCDSHLSQTNGPESTSSSAATSSSASIPPGTGLIMARTLDVLKGATPAQALAKYPGTAPTGASATGGAPGAAGQPVGGSSAGTTYYTPAPEESGADGMLLNYLLGD
jgi:ABC-type transporter Mla subunit MlaD